MSRPKVEREDPALPGMPDGKKLRVAMARIFRGQRKRALQLVDQVEEQIARIEVRAGVKAAELPAIEVDWDRIEWGGDPVGPDEELLPPVTPLLTAYWDDAGEELAGELNKIRVRAGLDEVEWKVTDPLVARSIRAAALEFCEATNATTRMKLADALRKLRTSLASGTRGGEAARELRNRVKAIFRDAETWRAERIARTEAIRAYNEARAVAARRSHVTAGLKWLTASNACPLCQDVAARAGRIRNGGVFARVETPRAVYSEIRHPPLHPHCCLPETPVVAPVGIAGIKAQYDGPVVRLHFVGGGEVAVTPNHMFLSPDGFVTADFLVEGDHLLRSGVGEPMLSGDPDDDRKPATIQQVFDTWAEASLVPPACVPVAPEYLHGDAALCQGYVNVVPAHGELRNDLDTLAAEPAGHGSLGRPDMGQVGLPGCGDLAKLLFALRDATDGGVGSLREQRAKSRVRPAHPQKHSLGTVPGLDSGLQKDSADSPSTGAERVGDSLLGLPAPVAAGDGVGFRSDESGPQWWSPGEADERQAIAVIAARHHGMLATAQVARVERVHYSGPVYDLQTATSLYLIGPGIVSSNCRCAVAVILKPEYGGPAEVEWAAAPITPGQPEAA